jgi:hypothetical protein
MEENLGSTSEGAPSARFLSANKALSKALDNLKPLLSADPQVADCQPIHTAGPFDEQEISLRTADFVGQALDSVLIPRHRAKMTPPGWKEKAKRLAKKYIQASYPFITNVLTIATQGSAVSQSCRCVLMM